MTHDVYLIGSLRSPRVLEVAHRLREVGLEVFDQWYAAGHEADDLFYEYAKQRGWSHGDALRSDFARHVFEFDKRHIDASRIGVLVMPAGKSGHLELGYMRGQGKPGFILFDEEPERFDQMHQFSSGWFYSVDALIHELESRK